MRQAIKQCSAPELVNDSSATCPSARVRRDWPTFAKRTDGPALVGEIGLEVLRAACPHFDSWLTRLESL